MYFACYSRLALGVALPSLALYLTPRSVPGEERETENIITRARQKLGGEQMTTSSKGSTAASN